MDEEIKDIIQKLLVKEPNARLGAAITGILVNKNFKLISIIRT